MVLNIMNELELQIAAATEGQAQSDHVSALNSRADGIESGEYECQTPNSEWTEEERATVARLLRDDAKRLIAIDLQRDNDRAYVESFTGCTPR